MLKCLITRTLVFKFLSNGQTSDLWHDVNLVSNTTISVGMVGKYSLCDTLHFVYS